MNKSKVTRFLLAHPVYAILP